MAIYLYTYTFNRLCEQTRVISLYRNKRNRDNTDRNQMTENYNNFYTIPLDFRLSIVTLTCGMMIQLDQLLKIKTTYYCK